MADQTGPMATDDLPAAVGASTTVQPIPSDAGAPPSDERPSKRLKVASEGVSSDAMAVDSGEPKSTTTTEPVSEAVPALDSQQGSVAAVAAPSNGNDIGAPSRRAGIAPIKAKCALRLTSHRYLVKNQESSSTEVHATAQATPENQANTSQGNGIPAGPNCEPPNAQASEGSSAPAAAPNKRGKNKKERGQNVGRSYGRFEESVQLCASRAMTPEFSPDNCQFGEKCKLCHNLREYLEARPKDTSPETGVCPQYELFGRCPAGFKCRFIEHHMTTYEHPDGQKELVLTQKRASSGEDGEDAPGDEPILERYDPPPSTARNIVDKGSKIELSRRRVNFQKADDFCNWLDQEAKINDTFHNRQRKQADTDMAELRAQFVEPPFLPSEKRRLYFGPETPALAPLTTQGNLPFRRLCVELGCELTYSEMAMSGPLLQGQKADWTLMKAHDSELAPPNVSRTAKPIVEDYDNSKDMRFGAQISGHSHRMVTRAADILNRYCPSLRLIDLNCGCPIDMVYKSGAGAGILDSKSKLERMVRGMNALSGEIPITVKLRTGVQSNRPVATTIIGKLAFGAREHRSRLGAPGCAAVTLHGRSREQRYTKKADWSYIAECAALVKSYNAQVDLNSDTSAEPDARTLPNSKDGKMYFLGNGDCYSHVEYYNNVAKSGVDTIMIGRGALIKPWIFEEIKAGQYLDKSSTERLEYVKKYVDYGLEAWGSDDIGVGYTRRFLLEWLSFAHRYVPIGLLEYLPPDMNDRPAAYVGRDDFETKLASRNYKDWIKISEHFLGKTPSNFKFEPKHKSNSYEAVEG
ncbi:hypothetical protein jhhlp_005156 [Lomentospora prolificans]|uniref:tRNA-dihydrouridine(47) synthase [NAD(P)(+)] n=1 Tax=Lomentospora prolificans TaxID=41688 RepID=A0A2N3N734_9PEZI|nr:hypothetical protein jhhlp_005156 [Lomentospora prolificans]